MAHKYIPEKLDSSAVELLVSAVVSGDAYACEVADAAYHVEGFVLGKFVPCNHPKESIDSLSKEEKAEKLLLLTSKAGTPDIPYLAIWMILRQIIDSYLNKF